MPRRKYVTKYSELSIDERKQIQKTKTKEWCAKQPKERIKQYVSGYCEACKHQYANITIHGYSKKHAKNIELTQQVVPDNSPVKIEK